MAERFRARNRTDEPWERGLYLLLLIVAVVVILYSLFGIATLLGYLPLSHSGAAGKQMQHPAVEAERSLNRIKDRPATRGIADTPCPRRASVKVTAIAPAVSASTVEPAGAKCAEGDPERVAVRNVAAPDRSNGRGIRNENASKPLDR